MKNKSIIFILSLLSFVACRNNGVGDVDAYVPVYGNMQDAKQITLQGPQPIVNGGKIATLGNYVYQVETDKGIHIIDYSNPAVPVKKGFIKNLLCRELAIKANSIYTNNLADLVVINISNINTVTVSSRIDNAFPDLALQYPPCTDCYFECADPAKGLVIQWNKQKVSNPKCKK
ncbi:MAG: hypothetical protein ABIO79_14650 [Ferruginibacter sp.]